MIDRFINSLVDFAMNVPMYKRVECKLSDKYNIAVLHDNVWERYYTEIFIISIANNEVECEREAEFVDAYDIRRTITDLVEEYVGVENFCAFCFAEEKYETGYEQVEIEGMAA